MVALSELRNPDDYLFPDCVVATIAKSVAALDSVLNIEYRGLSPDDPSGTVGFDVINWTAGEEEMAGHSAGLIPSMAEQVISVEFMFKHSDSSMGEELHRQTCREIRTMLYADPTLAIALGTLSRTADGVIERMLRWKVMRQVSGSSKINSGFVSVSAIEFTFTTEMTPE